MCLGLHSQLAPVVRRARRAPRRVRPARRGRAPGLALRHGAGAQGAPAPRDGDRRRAVRRRRRPVRVRRRGADTWASPRRRGRRLRDRAGDRRHRFALGPRRARRGGCRERRPRARGAAPSSRRGSRSATSASGTGSLASHALGALALPRRGARRVAGRLDPPDGIEVVAVDVDGWEARARSSRSTTWAVGRPTIRGSSPRHSRQGASQPAAAELQPGVVARRPRLTPERMRYRPARRAGRSREGDQAAGVPRRADAGRRARARAARARGDRRERRGRGLGLRRRGVRGGRRPPRRRRRGLGVGRSCCSR